MSYEEEIEEHMSPHSIHMLADEAQEIAARADKELNELREVIEDILDLKLIQEVENLRKGNMEQHCLGCNSNLEQGYECDDNCPFVKAKKLLGENNE